MSLKIKLPPISILLPATLLFGTLLLPATREAHLLCVRLLTHVKGSTFVQGQPSGCIIYTIPNVQFTEKFQHELRKRSMLSLDDYILASATGSYFDLEPPSATSWTNHPLLEWAALRFAWISVQRRSLNFTNLAATNATAISSIKTARRAIELAQTIDSTNGALWLAEACIDFTEQDDEAALAALKRATTKQNWGATTDISRLHQPSR